MNPAVKNEKSSALLIDGATSLFNFLLWLSLKSNAVMHKWNAEPDRTTTVASKESLLGGGCEEMLQVFRRITHGLVPRS